MESTILIAPSSSSALSKDDVQKKSSVKKPVTVEDFENGYSLEKEVIIMNFIMEKL